MQNTGYQSNWLACIYSPPALSPAVAQRCFGDWESPLSGGVSIATKGGGERSGECKGM